MLQFFAILLPIAIMTAGPLLSLFYKELFNKKEYYFYYNRGLSKTKLIIVTIIFNFVIGALLHFILTNV